MRFVKFSSSVAVLALLLSCSGGGSDPQVTPTPTPPTTPALTIITATPATAAGTHIHVETSSPADQVEVRIGGTLVSAYFEVFDGGFYNLPDGLTPGEVTVGVRRTGDATDEATYTLTITEPLFEDVAQAMGLANDHNANSDANPCMPISSGLAVGDINNDGLQDVYVGNLGSGGLMYLNDGDTDGDGLPNFTDRASIAGLADIDNISASSFMDYDNDGDLDLMLGRWGEDLLLKNMLTETGFADFVDVTAEMGIQSGINRTVGITWGDYDNDGDLDLYLVRHSHCGLGPIEERKPHDQFLRNDGDRFTDVTNLLGDGVLIAALGFAAVFVDYDLDGDQDLLVANDFISEEVSFVNCLWRNDGPGTDGQKSWVFTEVGAQSGFGPPLDADQIDDASDTVNAMGISVGDLNGDRYPDVTISNMGPNLMFFNNGDGTFRDVSAELGVERTQLPWGLMSITWGTQLLDFDNDMDLDVFYAGGRIDVGESYPHAFFRNDGLDQPFTDITWEAGLADMASGKASAFADLDGDGFTEFLVANNDGPLRAYRNRCEALGVENNWLIVELEGLGIPGKSNRNAIGAAVHLTTPDGKTQTAFQTSKPSLGSGGQLICNFGLGTNESVSNIVVDWPNGTQTTHVVDGINKTIRILEP